MPRRYRDIYPSLPLIDSEGIEHVSAARLMSVQYFRAPPDAMPEDVAAPLGRIALDCGFADQAHFTRSFKQIVGVTPSAHRAGAGA